MTHARTLLTEASRRLGAAGVGSPAVDAELLLAHSLGTTRSRLVLVEEVAPEVAPRFAALVARRAAREPLQHILGRAAFRRVEVSVGSGVFVPRPETELLVDAVLPGLACVERAVVVDLCAGSGVIGLAIAEEVPGAVVHAVECSAGALRWLRRNCAGTRVVPVAGDVADPQLLAALRGSIDAVLSNPPYVPAALAVDAEVRADPPVAVFAGEDGLSVIPAVIARAGELLRAGGMFALEHDESHAGAVLSLLAADGRWSALAAHRDLAGRARYVTAERSPRAGDR